MAPTPRDILGPDEVWIGDTFFPVSKPVTVTSITVVPNPVIFGDTAKRGDTQTLSQFMQANAQGGGGVYRGNARTDAERSWTTECDTRFNFVTLPPLDVTIGKPAGAGSTTDANLLIEYGNEVYVAWGSDLYKVVDGSPPTWSSLEQALDAVPTDWAEYKGNLRVATGAKLYQRTGGGVWTNQTIEATFVENFASKLYILGQVSGTWTIRWSAIGDFSEAAPGGGWPIIGDSGVTPRGMVVYRDAAGAKKIYISTSRGFYVFDENSNTISASEIMWSTANNSGRTPKVFRDGRLYTTLGSLGVLQVQGGNPIIGQPVGLDRDDGVPTAEQASVIALEAEANWLYAMLDGSAPSATTVTETTSGGYPSGEWDNAATGSSTIRAYGTGPGWHRVWTSNGSGFAGTALLASQAYSKKRLYWGADRQVWYMDLPTGLYNPRFNPNQQFSARPCRLITPWWFLTSELEQKTVPHFLLQVRDATATETVAAYYATDLDDNVWNSLTTVTGPGLVTVKLNNGQGITGRWWRFALDLSRASGTNTARPMVELWGPQFMPMLTAEYGFALEIDTTKAHRNKSPEQLKNALERLADPSQTSNLVEFAFSDNISDAGSQAQTYLARVMRFQAQRYTGRQRRGQGKWLVSLIAPSKADSV